MKKDCEKYIEAILSTDENYSSEIKEHIAQCNECRIVASEWETIRSVASEVDVPEYLDSKIKIAAFNRKNMSKMWNTIYRFLYISAAAACVILVMAIFMFSDKRPEVAEKWAGANYSWKSQINGKLFEIDTEIELNREMINLGIEKKINYDDVLNSPLDDSEHISISTDSWI